MVYDKHAKFHLDRFILSPSVGETPPPIFAVFSTSVFSVVASWQQCEKVEHGCTTTDLPLSNGIKIVSVLQRLHGEMGRTISDVQKRDEHTDRQTNRQKTQRFWPPRRRLKSEPHQTWHGDRGDLEHVLAPPKLLGAWRIDDYATAELGQPNYIL